MSHRNEAQHLQNFNQQISKYQEEIYTLAYFLTGDDQSAAMATERACLESYRLAGSSLQGLRLVLIHQVLICCRKYPKYRRSDLDFQGLDHLPESERKAALLVDILGLTYEEAMAVLECSKAKLSEWLAQARLHLAGFRSILIQTASEIDRCSSRPAAVDSMR